MRAIKRRSRPKDKYTRDLESFIPQYIAATGDVAWTAATVAAWAIDNDLWEQREVNAIRQLARELSAVARQVTFLDENGNEVRKYHAYRLGDDQPMLWEGIEEIAPENMERAKTMRRAKLVAGAIKLTIDLNYYNETVNPGDSILFDTDFQRDIADYFQPSLYDDTPPLDSAELPPLS